MAATLQSATSFGYALVLAPVLLAVVEPAEAIATVLILAGALNLLMLFGEGRVPQPSKPHLMALLVAAVPGMLVGVVILGALSKSTLQILAGVAVIAAGALLLRAEMAEEDSVAAGAEAEPRRWLPMAVGAGGAAGVLATTTSTSGPPLVLFLHWLGLSPMRMRDSITAAFLFLNLVGAAVVIVLVGGQADAPEPLRLALLLVVTAVGQQLGRVAFERLEPKVFRRAGLALVLVAGIASVLAGAVG